MGKIAKEGLTFDDVLLIPQYSEVLPYLVLALPTREDVDSQIAEHMIVELYSK